MATVLARCFINVPRIPFVRYKFPSTPPEKAKSLKQILKEKEYVDPQLYFLVDIGFKPSKPPRTHDIRQQLLKVRSSKELERLSRLHQLEVPLEGVEEAWKTTVAPFHLKTIAEHYGVFKDLFGDAYFYPVVPLDICYPSGDLRHTVYRGNVIKPQEASAAPEVRYEAKPDSLWTLILTNPDGHLYEKDSEYVHWFVGNIPGNDVDKGDLIWDYMQPFPARGTGFHRFIYVLYKQEKKIDFSALKQDYPCVDLRKRTFHTEDFYRKYQDVLTPAGLAFFQCDWDNSVKTFFHHVLDMKEPVFEYDFPEPYIRPQVWFPIKQPFNTYMDKYRDPRDVNKEFLLRKLKNRSPFQKPPPPLRFPNAHPFDNNKVPSWLRVEIQKERLRWGKINEFVDE